MLTDYKWLNKGTFRIRDTIILIPTTASIHTIQKIKYEFGHHILPAFLEIELERWYVFTLFLSAYLAHGWEKELINKWMNEYAGYSVSIWLFES